MLIFVLVKQTLDTGVLEFEWFENEKDAVGAFNEFIVSSERKTNNCKLLETTVPSENVEKHVQDNLETIYNQQKPLLRLIYKERNRNDTTRR